jgi:hypothetical protein
MKMTEDLTRESFAENLNSKFMMTLPEAEPLALDLIEVTEIPSVEGQEQFSVIFQAPLNAPVRQGIYTLEHERLGEFGIFLVPIGKDKNGVQYEAFFNRVNL